jgi:hypothetical protein
VLPPLVVQVRVSTSWAGFEGAAVTSAVLVLAAGSLAVSFLVAQVEMPCGVLVQVAVWVDALLPEGVGELAARAGAAESAPLIRAAPATVDNALVRRM